MRVGGREKEGRRGREGGKAEGRREDASTDDETLDGIGIGARPRRSSAGTDTRGGARDVGGIHARSGDFKGDEARRGVASRPLRRAARRLAKGTRKSSASTSSTDRRGISCSCSSPRFACGGTSASSACESAWSGRVRRGSTRREAVDGRARPRLAIFFARRARDRLAREERGDADVTRGVEAYLPRGARDETKTQTDGNLGAHVNLGGCGVSQRDAGERVSVARPRSIGRSVRWWWTTPRKVV